MTSTASPGIFRAHFVLAVVLLVAWSIPTSAQDFTTDTAFASVVTFSPSPVDPAYLDGFDAAGWAIWSSGPSGTWGFLRDASHQIVDEVDSFGDRISFKLDADGRAAEVLHQLNSANTWTDRFLYDADGRTVVEAVEGESSRLAERLKSIGINPDHPMAATTVERSEDSGAGWTWTSNPMFQRTVWDGTALPADPLSGGDGTYFSQETDGLGLSLTVSMALAADGLKISDDWGGERLHTYDDLGRLVTIADASGFIVRIAWDEENRPADVYLGEVGRLHYTYDERGWTKKELVDRRSSEVLYTVTSAYRPGETFPRAELSPFQPRKVTRVDLADDGPIVEWDDALGASAHLVATLGIEPYALIPVDSGKPLVRSLTPFLTSLMGSMGDRIDYTEDTIVLHLMTDEGTRETFGEETAAIVMPRRDVPSGPTLLPDDGCPPGCVCTQHDRAGGTDIIIRCPPPSPPLDPHVPPPPGHPPGGDQRQPHPPGTVLTALQNIRLSRGKSIALQHLHQPQCGNLFISRHYPNGDVLINETTYRNGEGVRAPNNTIPCHQGAAAWTNSRSRVVMLCRSFETLSDPEAAVKVIHEALHTGGLGENPPDPNAMTPAQIDLLVRSSCGL